MFYRTRFENKEAKITWIVIFLRNLVFDQIKVYFNNYIENRKVNSNDIIEETIKIFANLAKFFGAIKKVFGNINKKRNTERKLEILKQKENTSNYTIEF